MRLISILIILILLTVSFPFLPVCDTADAAMTASIELTNPYQTADVSPGGDGIVTFDGLVTVNSVGAGSNVQEMVVTLNGEASGFPTSISPSTLVFTPQEKGIPKAFVATVQVPMGTCSQISYELQVSGQIRGVPGTLLTTIPPTTGIIEIDQYYEISVSCDEPYQESVKKEAIDYIIDIHNAGNGYDEFRIDLPNLDDPTYNDWAIYPDTDLVLLGCYDYNSLSITVKPPSYAPFDRYPIDIRITSEGSFEDAGVMIYYDYTIYCDVVPGSSEPELEDDDDTDDAEPDPDGDDDDMGENGDDGNNSDTISSSDNGEGDDLENGAEALSNEESGLDDDTGVRTIPAFTTAIFIIGLLITVSISYEMKKKK